MTRLRLAATLCVLAASAARAQSADVTVPIRVFNNHVYVRMTTTGAAERWMLLDSGAPVSLMNLATADSLGAATVGQANFGGVGAGRTAGAQISGITLRLPEDTSVSVTPRVAMRMALSTLEGMEISGILGHDFITQRVLEIDYAGQRLTLHDAKRFTYAGNGVRVPITIRDNYAHVDAELVLADGGRVRGDFILDVGSSSAMAIGKTLVEKNHLLERVTPTIYRSGGRGAGGATKARFGRIPELHIGGGGGGATLTNVVAAMHGDSSGVFSTDRLFEGNIGGDVLRRFTVFFDYAHKEVIFQPNAANAEPFEVDMSGAGYRADTAGIRVLDVMENGPAAKAGLRVDDLIVSVDGRPALDLGLEALRKRVRKEGPELVLVVRREGEANATIRIPLKRLV